MQSGDACEKISDLDFSGGQLINLFVNGRLPKKKKKTGIERLPRFKKILFISLYKKETNLVSIIFLDINGAEQTPLKIEQVQISKIKIEHQEQKI